MKRKKIVAGNWKMNLSWSEASDLIAAVREKAKQVTEVQKLFFPPFPYLHLVNDLIKEETNFSTGAQNCSEFAKGAYTGEVSAAMIRNVGCSFVLVGHSERRACFSENKDQLSGKINRALENELSVIFCFGELLAERKAGTHFEAVKQQLKEVLNQFPFNKTSSLVLAYEPVWAIGTGETASPLQAQEMHAFVRKTVSEIFSAETASTMSILYGGSCNAQNAKELFACPDVDGGLIGGASLKSEEFCTIISSF